MEGILCKTPHLPGNSNIELHTFLSCFFGLTELPHLQEIPIPTVGENGYFLELNNTEKNK